MRRAAGSAYEVELLGPGRLFVHRDPAAWFSGSPPAEPVLDAARGDLAEVLATAEDKRPSRSGGGSHSQLAPRRP